MLDTIKEYLVSLGFAVDQNSYNEATKVMDNAGESVAKFAGSAVKKFAIAGAAVEGFVAATTIGIAKFLGGLAQADLANEKLARQMWTSKDAAASYNNTLKAMGVTLQDLYLSPELMRNFQRLREQANEMRAPDEYAQQMKQIRSIQFEFTRMKLEATYSLQWIGYYFVKYMEGPIQNIKKTLSGVNDNVTKDMPSWTKNIAQVMSWFARLGVTSVRALKDIIQAFDDASRGIPRSVKLIAAGLSLLGIIISTGPIGMISALIVGLLLLLDDFYTYLDGGESEFPGFWRWVLELGDKFDGVGETISKAKDKVKEFFQQFVDNGTLDNVKTSFKNAFEFIGTLIDGAEGKVEKLYDKLEEEGEFSGLAKDIGDAAASIANFTEAATKALDELAGLKSVQETLDAISNIMDDYVVLQFKRLRDYIHTIRDDFQAFADLLNGDFASAGKKFASAAGDLFKAKTGINIPSWATDWITNSGGSKQTPGNQPMSYLYPQNNTQNSNNKITLNQTNNIQSSDPSSIVGSVTVRTMDTLRNFMGVIR